jgi:hypothetical protein
VLQGIELGVDQHQLELESDQSNKKSGQVAKKELIALFKAV